MQRAAARGEDKRNPATGLWLPPAREATFEIVQVLIAQPCLQALDGNGAAHPLAAVQHHRPVGGYFGMALHDLVQWNELAANVKLLPLMRLPHIQQQWRIGCLQPLLQRGLVYFFYCVLLHL